MMTARRTTTPTTTVVATKPRSTKQLLVMGAIGIVAMQSCIGSTAQAVSDMSPVEVAKVAPLAAAAGFGATAAGAAAFCVKFPQVCKDAIGRVPRTKVPDQTQTPITAPPATIPPVTAPRPTVPLPVAPTPTVRGRPVVPPAPSIPTAPTAVPVIPGKAPTRATICTPIFTPLPGGSVGGGGQVCS